ncbi:hypothetical protein CANCADRAFT_1246 [Tortispora caseinolytica NRRL Y-17796]|uniref:Thioredoxin domain-containing protein n=1 Tax=Tortispora caseinolytica NRRL Y-17796 TaxID=767744 RepID=A0A1E4TLM1_9ASCO|nr:hypothetical protein CANCADRAFT_1246 [Tortispora caseinolytica NRRL Y-17796]
MRPIARPNVRPLLRVRYNSTNPSNGTGGKYEFSRKPLTPQSTNFEEVKAKHEIGMFNWKAGLFFVVVAIGLTVVFQREKKRLELRRIAEENKTIGKPAIGGKFSMIDTNKQPFTEENLKGKFSLLYFGFTLCPDICPEELDNIVYIMEKLKKEGITIQPVFITCDPARDDPETIKDYLEEFHPDIIGLTGTYDDVKAMCKTYRVYFSTPPNVKPGQDYLVDHSIFFYLMDPEGNFVEALGRQYTKDQAVERIKDHITHWAPSDDKKSSKIFGIF